MSHFYSSCQGGRGTATRCGHRTTGIFASVKNWSVELCLRGNHNDGVDKFSLEVSIVDNAKFAGDPAYQKTTVMPILVKFDARDNKVHIQHNVEEGQQHNIKASQASFDNLLEIETDDVPF